MRFMPTLAGAAAAILAANSAPSWAESSFPTQPVHLVVGYSPGGGSDIITRIVGNALAERWGHPVIVENRPGADGSIAADHVAHSAPNGYTMIMVTNSHTAPPDYKLTYDPVKSFETVSLADTKPMVLLVNPQVPAHSVADLIALAKAKPGSLNFGTDGQASDPYMITKEFMRRAGIDMTAVNYKGGGQSQIDLLSGQIQVLMGTFSAALPLIQAGSLRALAVTTAKRNPLLPDVPAMGETAGLAGFDEGIWNGILVPAGTPSDIVEKIHADIVAIMHDPKMIDTLNKQGITPVGSSPAEFKTVIVDEIEARKAVK